MFLTPDVRLSELISISRKQTLSNLLLKMSIEVHRKAEFNIYNNFILLLVFFSQLSVGLYLKGPITKGDIQK